MNFSWQSNFWILQGFGRIWLYLKLIPSFKYENIAYTTQVQKYNKQLFININVVEELWK